MNIYIYIVHCFFIKFILDNLMGVYLIHWNTAIHDFNL